MSAHNAGKELREWAECPADKRDCGQAEWAGLLAAQADNWERAARAARTLAAVQKLAGNDKASASKAAKSSALALALCAIMLAGGADAGYIHSSRPSASARRAPGYKARKWTQAERAENLEIARDNLYAAQSSISKAENAAICAYKDFYASALARDIKSAHSALGARAFRLARRAGKIRRGLRPMAQAPRHMAEKARDAAIGMDYAAACAKGRGDSAMEKQCRKAADACRKVLPYAEEWKKSAEREDKAKVRKGGIADKIGAY